MANIQKASELLRPMVVPNNNTASFVQADLEAMKKRLLDIDKQILRDYAEKDATFTLQCLKRREQEKKNMIVKTFKSGSPERLDREINEWLKEMETERGACLPLEDIEIFQSGDTEGNIIITVWYEKP